MKRQLRKQKTAAAMAFFMAFLSITGCVEKKTEEQIALSSEEETAHSSFASSIGSYLEEDLPLPEKISSIQSLQAQKDGSLSMVCGAFDGEAMNYFLGTSKDNGQTWDQTPLEEYLGVTPEEAQSMLTFALGKEGQGFFGQFLSQDEDNFSMKCWYRSPKGEVTLLPLSQEMENTFVTDAAFDEQGRLYLCALSKGVLMVDPEANDALHWFEEGNTPEFMGISKNCLTIVTGGAIHCYDTQTQKPMEEMDVFASQIQKTTKTLANTNSSSVPLLFLEDEEGMFFLNSQGLFHYAFGGTLVEQILDGSRNSISSPSTGFTSLTRGIDGSFYLGTTNFDNSVSKGHIYRYTYQEDASALPLASLNIYSLKENGFLSQAASLFQAKHPDIQITVQTGLTGEDGVTQTDALKTLNTEILAGKGPDILFLDGLSTDTYVEKGLLLDISSVLSETELLDNIRNAYQNSEGAIYSMPVSFGIPMIQGQQEDVERITDLTSLADVICDHTLEYGVGEGYSDYNYYIPGHFAMTLESLLFSLSSMCQSAWVSPNGHLDEDAIKDFLTQTGRIYQAEKKALDALWEKYPEFSQYQEPDNDPPDSLAYSSTSVFREITLLTLGGLYSPFQLALLDTVEKEEGSSLSSREWNTQCQGQFLPVNEVGVSAKTSDRDTAFAFIRFLFSEEGQSISGQYGFPILKSLYEDTNFWSMGKPGEVISSNGDFNHETGIEFNLDICAPKEQSIHRIQELGKSLTHPASWDAIFQEAVTKTGLRYLKEEISLSEAVDSIQKELGLYLAE